MPVDILVPPLSQTMDTLVLLEWVKKVGDPVIKGETLFRVETDKATLEVESPASGILYEVNAEPKTEVKIRSSIGKILEPGELTSRQAVPAPTPAAVPAAAQPGAHQDHARSRSGRIFATPRARNLAAASGIDLTDLKNLQPGSGPRKEIISKDVSAYLEQKNAPHKATPVARRMAEQAGLDLGALTPAKAGAPLTRADVESALAQRADAPQSAGIPPLQRQTLTLSPMRQTIARRLRDSLDSAVPVTYQREVDATGLVKLRKRILKSLAEGALRPTYTDFLVYLTARTLQKHPNLNATFDGKTLELYEHVHMALAVDTERGLIVPVLRAAEGKGIAELAQSRSDLVEKALAGSLKPEEMSGGTFTISNLGTLGVDAFTPVINPPQVAILGVGRIRELPAVHNGKLRVRHMLGLSLTCDHRIVDGAPAARFLQDLCTMVENPDLIWL